jgi:hypothetical protein
LEIIIIDPDGMLHKITPKVATSGTVEDLLPLAMNSLAQAGA